MKNNSEKPNLRKAQAEERRRQILETTLAVFAAKGFDGTSIKDIAQAAGISQGLMYHYFAGKEDLLRATVEYHSFIPQLCQILNNASQLSIEKVFENIANGFMDLLYKKKMLVSLLIREIEANSEVKKAWSNLCQEGVSLIQKYLEAHIASGELRPHNTEVTARNLFAIVFMYHFTGDVFQSSPVTRSQFIEATLSNLMRGIENR